jgi:hypothetical protein
MCDVLHLLKSKAESHKLAKDSLIDEIHLIFDTFSIITNAVNNVKTWARKAANVGSCRAIGQLCIKAQRLEAESRPSHGRSYWKRTEEKGKEWKGKERKESSHMILLYIRKGKLRKRK